MTLGDHRKVHDFYRTFFWHVNLHGLTKSQAEEILTLGKERYGLTGDLVDPKYWFALYVDRETAEVLRAALLGLREEDTIGLGLREQVEEWLELSQSLQNDD